jgi:excisionase family DNA binding protein
MMNGSEFRLEPFLSTKEAAALLGLRPNTLEKMRVYGGGPIYRKHGRKVRYHLNDLMTWSEGTKRLLTPKRSPKEPNGS